MASHRFICPRCGNISPVRPQSSFKCGVCRFEMSRRDYTKIIDFGSSVIRYGIHYRRKYEHDLKIHGKLRSRYSLADPTIVLSFVGAAIAGGILGNASYDVLKYCLKGLASSLQGMRLRSRSIAEKKPFASTQDLDIIHRLLGKNDDYRDHFRRDIQDYLEGMPGAHPDIRAMLIQEEAIHREISKVRKSLENVSVSARRQYVFVTRSGEAYHSRNCHLIRGAKQRISIHKARQKYRPCCICKPD
jgi:hypothetical protein